MILDLLDKWPVDQQRSFLVGDSPRDIAAAESAGIKAHLFTGGNLKQFVEAILEGPIR